MLDPYPQPLNKGDILAKKLRVERILDEGGMGIVLAATHIDRRSRKWATGTLRISPLITKEKRCGM